MGADPWIGELATAIAGEWKRRTIRPRFNLRAGGQALARNRTIAY